MIEYDNRHLWMKLKTIKGSHFANYREAWDANQLVCEGKILPPLSAVHALDNVGEAAYQVHQNLHEGKIGVLCLAPEEGLGIDDPELRAAGGRGPHHPLPEARRMTEMLLTEIDHVAIAVPDLDAAVAYYQETFGATVAHRERDRLRRRGGGPAQGGRQLHPAAHADQRLVAGGQVPGEEGARASTTSATGWPTAPSPSSRSRTTAARSSTRRRVPAPGAPPWPSSTRRVPSAPSSSWSRSRRPTAWTTPRGPMPRRPACPAIRPASAARTAPPRPDPGPASGCPHIRARSAVAPAPVPSIGDPTGADGRRVRRLPGRMTSTRHRPGSTGSGPCPGRHRGRPRSRPGWPPSSGCYVYLLVDPRSGRPFFVGRGRGDRCHRHVEAARGRGVDGRPVVEVPAASTASARSRPAAGRCGSRSSATA